MDDVGLENINQELEPSTRRSILKTAGAALATGATVGLAGCQQTPNESSTSTVPGEDEDLPGTQTDDSPRDQEPTPPESDGDSASSYTRDEAFDHLTDALVESYELGSVEWQMNEFYATAPHLIAENGSGELVESMRNTWNSEFLGDIVDFENAGYHLLQNGWGHILLGHEPENTRQGLQDNGFEEDSSHRGYETWKKEWEEDEVGYDATANPTAAINDEHVIVMSPLVNLELDSMEALDLQLDTWNGDTDGYLDTHPGRGDLIHTATNQGELIKHNPPSADDKRYQAVSQEYRDGFVRGWEYVLNEDSGEVEVLHEGVTIEQSSRNAGTATPGELWPFT